LTAVSIGQLIRINCRWTDPEGYAARAHHCAIVRCPVYLAIGEDYLATGIFAYVDNKIGTGHFRLLRHCEAGPNGYHQQHSE
jgi:hypothetical protein